MSKQAERNDALLEELQGESIKQLAVRLVGIATRNTSPSGARIPDYQEARCIEVELERRGVKPRPPERPSERAMRESASSAEE